MSDDRMKVCQDHAEFLAEIASGLVLMFSRHAMYHGWKHGIEESGQRLRDAEAALATEQDRVDRLMKELAELRATKARSHCGDVVGQ